MNKNLDIDISSADKCFTYYSTDLVKNVYERWIKDVLGPIWKDEKLGIKPAKTEDYDKIDTPYPVHILNGFSSLLSLVDHRKSQGKALPENLEEILYKVGLAFALHDYNKLVDSDKDMTDIDVILPDLVDKLGYDELEDYPGMDLLKALIVGTEQGTTGLEPNYEVPPSRHEFEMKLMRAADARLGLQEKDMRESEVLSQKVNKAWLDIWGEDVEVNCLNLNPTPFYGIKSAIEQAIRIYIYESEHRTIVANTKKSVVFLGSKIGYEELEDISLIFREYLLKEIFSPETSVKASDRRFEIGIFGIVPPQESHIVEWAKNENNFDKYIRISGRRSGKDRENIEGYRESVEKLNSKFEKNDIPLTLRKDKPEFEKNRLNSDKHSDFLISAAVLRIYQLLLSDKDKSDTLEKWYNKFKESVEKYADDFCPLYYYNEHKSAVLPLLLAAEGVFENPKEEVKNVIKVIEDIEGEPFDNFSEIFFKLVSIPGEEEDMILNFEEMPDKENMCIATGGWGEKEATKDRLQGINKQTFTNRAEISLKSNSGKVSDLYALESKIREQALATGNYERPTVLYASTSCFAPNVDLGQFLDKVLREGEETEIEEGRLEIGKITCGVMNDSVLYATIPPINSVEEALLTIYRVLKLTKESRLQVLLRTTNELVEDIGNHIFSASLSSPEIEELGYDRVSLKELDFTLEEMANMASIGSSGDNFSGGLAEAATSYLNSPLSLFTLAESNAEEEGGRWCATLGKSAYEILEKRGENLKEMKKIAEAAYRVQKSSGNSRTDRTWLFMEPLEEIISKEVEAGNAELDDIAPAIAGHIQQRAQNRNPPDRHLSQELEEASLDLAEAIVDFIKDYWDGKLPEDERRRNAVNTFQFLFSHLCFNQGEWNL